MVSSLLHTVAEVAHPRVLARLWDAGLLKPDPSGFLATLRTIPWLVGRGPTLGTISQIHASGRPDRAAIHDRHGSLTWQQLDERVNRLARTLERLGVSPGQRVALLLRNGREFVEVALATQKTGRGLIPLNTWLKTGELRVLLDDARPAVLVYDTRHSGQVPLGEGGPPLVAVGEPDQAVKGSLDYEDLLEDADGSPPAPITRDRGSSPVLMHTSGTAGTPKALERNPKARSLLALIGLLQTVPYRRNDIVLCSAPLFHSFGLLTFSVAGVLGITLVLPDRFDPEQTLADIERHGVTAASLVPTMLRRICSLPAETRERYDVSSVRIILTSGAPLPPELRDEATELFGEVLYDLYGSTEAGWVSIATPEDVRERRGTVGRPGSLVTVEIRDERGRVLGPGERGEIHVISELTFEGYTSDEQPHEGAFATGDQGWVDEDGYLYVAGRADDMVIIGGENVYPAEVEAVIGSIHGVEDVAVLGVPDEEYGEVLAAFVVGDTAEDEVRETCRERLASYKVPRHIQVVDDLPRTGTGKVRRQELRAAWQDEGER